MKTFVFNAMEVCQNPNEFCHIGSHAQQYEVIVYTALASKGWVFGMDYTCRTSGGGFGCWDDEDAYPSEDEAGRTCLKRAKRWFTHRMELYASTRDIKGVEVCKKAIKDIEKELKPKQLTLDL